MSWFTEFAGKAEDLLNKIDKNAAGVLQEVPGSSSSNKLTEVITRSGNNASNEVIEDDSGGGGQQRQSGFQRESSSSNLNASPSLSMKLSPSRSMSRNKLSQEDELMQVIEELSCKDLEAGKVKLVPFRKVHFSVVYVHIYFPFVKYISLLQPMTYM